MLVNHAAYVGIWHEAAPSSPQGALFSFRWAADGVKVVQLLPTKRYLTEIMQKPLCVLGPAHPRYSAVVVDGTKCVLRDHGSNHAGAVAPCAVAEAAASVAVFGPSGRRSSSGSSSSSSGSCQDVSEGSSPSSSAGFCSELLRFMQSSVQKVGLVDNALLVIPSNSALSGPYLAQAPKGRCTPPGSLDGIPLVLSCLL